MLDIKWIRSNPELFKAAIISLYENRENAVEMGKNGRKFIMDNLTREIGTSKYIDVLRSVAME